MKWRAVASMVVEPYELPMADDVLFVRELYNTLGAHLSVDPESGRARVESLPGGRIIMRSSGTGAGAGR